MQHIWAQEEAEANQGCRFPAQEEAGAVVFSRTNHLKQRTLDMGIGQIIDC